MMYRIKEPKKHLRYKGEDHSYCDRFNLASKKHLALVDILEEATCKNCQIAHRRLLDQALETIDSIAKNRVLSEVEIFRLVDEAYVDSDTMTERCRGIVDICNIVEGRMMSREELREAIKASFVKLIQNS